jgi:anti-anti-sigma factor
MSRGKILVAEKDGIYLLKLKGDVRVTLCASISEYIQKIFKGNKVKEVYVDLLEAECIDSTTLGLLAKLAIHTQQDFNLRTQLLCVNDDILRILDAMDIDGLFDILGLQHQVSNMKAEEIDPVDADESSVRQQVLEAHKLLVKLNPELMKEFYDLISSLEALE